MKFIKTHITTLLIVLFGATLLALQKPVTDVLIKKRDAIKKTFAIYYSVNNTYNLPQKLNEISGITWITDNTFAAVQDEDGILFIYDIKSSTIKNQIKFAQSGDYEAIAINKGDAYIMRSDGLIFEIINFKNETREISSFKTGFSSENNIESLTFDPENNRLLTAVKDLDLGEENFKNIYEIPLETKVLNKNPIIKINLTDNFLKKIQHKKIARTLSPSDIAIHPRTKQIYILEGKNPKLLILDAQGNFKLAFQLDKEEFPQPEGITFSDDGRLFISNEANDGLANILEVKLNAKENE